MRIVQIGQTTKKCWIVRGAPGSGKSTLAKKLGEGGVVLSSDDFFTINGKYLFHSEAQGDAHVWNQGRARKAMRTGTNPVVIDNTNMTWREIKPYANIAQECGYEIAYAEPDTPWKFDVDELARRNTHGVHKDVIQKMVDRWQPTDTLGMDK